MDSNVFIHHYKSGELVEEREVHNVFVDNGRTWLSNLIALLTLDDGNPPGDTFQTDARLRYFGVGIGGITASASAFGATLLAAYPPGYDPNASAGNTYQKEDPTGPPISTLERPIRRSGTQQPYPSAPGTDVWLYPDLLPYYIDNQSLTLDVSVDATGGEIIYGTFTDMPISEVALLNDDVGVDLNAPYSPVVAYVNFAPIVMTAISRVHFSWTVRFG
jgi:hypothetical protein